MTPERLTAKHPTLFHMADARAWPSIQRHGLLSTAALVELFGIRGAAREAILAGHRPDSVRLPVEGEHAVHGVAWVRDQRPLQSERLAACLDGTSPEAWRRELNGRVYFWPSRDRLERMWKVYAGEEQIILEVDTRGLLARYADRLELAAINTGNTKMPHGASPARRGADTFVPLADYARPQVAEATVPGAVPDVLAFTRRVTRRLRGTPESVWWEATDSPAGA